MTDHADAHIEPEAASRRTMLRTMAAGAAGVAVATVAGARPAAAADGDALLLGSPATPNTHETQTRTLYSGPTAPSSFTIEAGPNAAANNDGIITGVTASAGTAFLGVANEDGNQGVGVIGWSKKPLGTGLIGFTGGAGAYGGEFFGGRAEIRLRPGGTAPIVEPFAAHEVGELFEDASGTLWLCIAAGTPGSWLVLGGPLAAGAFHAISPKRVYDSRSGAGKVGPSEDRTISVATSAGADVVPPGATAVAITLTVTNTEGSVGGFVSARPAGTPYEGTSSINWFGPDQNIATTVISALGGDRELTLRGGEAPTDVVVDVTGFYR